MQSFTLIQSLHRTLRAWHSMQFRRRMSAQLPLSSTTLSHLQFTCVSLLPSETTATHLLVPVYDQSHRSIFSANTIRYERSHLRTYDIPPLHHHGLQRPRHQPGPRSWSALRGLVGRLQQSHFLDWMVGIRTYCWGTIRCHLWRSHLRCFHLRWRRVTSKL
jgi:hypothetical protein